MSYKTILVSLNEMSRLPKLIDAAALLGRAFQAHVSGLFAIPAVQIYPSIGFEAAPQLFEGNRKFFEDNASKVKAAFEEAMRKEGLSFDFHISDSRSPLVADAVVTYGRAADLIILSQPDPKELGGVESDFVEQTLMAAGRPVLILPFKGETKLDLSEILLGWDNGREAARAAFDALPLLKAAARVRVLRVDPQKDAGLKGKVPGADLAEALARHGVKAEAMSYQTESLGEGHALLRCATDNGCTLIVMGAYGHSRLTELIFGGATRHMLGAMDRPVLMSH
jgi:nucleotide-binding universal stress UspA family protein